MTIVTYTTRESEALHTHFTVTWPTLCGALRHVAQLRALPWISEIGVGSPAPNEAREGSGSHVHHIGPLGVSSLNSAARHGSARGHFLRGGA